MGKVTNLKCLFKRVCPQHPLCLELCLELLIAISSIRLQSIHCLLCICGPPQFNLESKNLIFLVRKNEVSTTANL